MTGVPRDGPLDHGDIDPLRPIRHEFAVLKDSERAGVRMPGNELDPAVYHQSLDRRHRLGGGQDFFGSLIDDHKQPDWFVDFHHLPRQPRPQVTGMAVHHSDQSGDVVGQFRAGTIAESIDDGKEIFEIDARSYWPDGSQRSCQDRAVVIGVWVVGYEECTPVEE